MAHSGSQLLAELMSQDREAEGSHSKELNQAMPRAPQSRAAAPQSCAASGPGSEDKTGASSPARSSGSGSPEPNCAICLGKLENKSFTDSCFHMFCFVCLLEWSKVKPECPLCKQKFKSIIHNVRSYDDYEQYHLERPENQRHSWENPNGHRFRYRTTMTVGPFHGVLDLIHTYSNRPYSLANRTYNLRRLNQPVGNSLPSTAPSTSARPWLSSLRLPRGSSPAHLQDRSSTLSTALTRRQGFRTRRCAATSEFRRRVYAEGLRVSRVQDEEGRRSTTEPEFFEGNPAATHRFIPWLNRELNALIHVEDHVQFVLELILGLINRFHIQSEEFYQHLQPYLGRNTRHFMHEFFTFARSPFNMAAYDTKAVYEPHMQEISDTEDVESSASDVICIDDSSSDEDEVRRLRSPPRLQPIEVRAQPRWEPLADSSLGLLRAQSTWNSPISGPSWDSSPERGDRHAASTSTTTTFSAPHATWSVGTSTRSSAGIKSESVTAPSSDSDSDSSSDPQDDVVVVAMEKPWRERSPIVLSSASEDEGPAVSERDSKKDILNMRIRLLGGNRGERNTSRRHRNRDGSERFACRRTRTQSRSRSPATYSSRHSQHGSGSRSRSHRDRHDQSHRQESAGSRCSRSARSRESHSKRSRSKESRGRDHRTSHRSSHSPSRSRKRHRTQSASLDFLNESMGIISGRRKKSKHKKHKKHKKHGKHKHEKKREDRHPKTNSLRHRSRRSRDDGEPHPSVATSEATGASTQLTTVSSEASEGSFKKHPSGHKSVLPAGSEPPNPGVSGATLEVAMEIDVGSTSPADHGRTPATATAGPSAEVITISSDDDCQEVTVESEQQSYRPLNPVELALRLRRDQVVVASSDESEDDGYTPCWPSLLEPRRSSCRLMGLDPMLSDTVTSPLAFPTSTSTGTSTTLAQSSGSYPAVTSTCTSTTESIMDLLQGCEYVAERTSASHASALFSGEAEKAGESCGMGNPSSGASVRWPSTVGHPAFNFSRWMTWNSADARDPSPAREPTPPATCSRVDTAPAESQRGAALWGGTVASSLGACSFSGQTSSPSWAFRGRGAMSTHQSGGRAALNEVCNISSSLGERRTAGRWEDVSDEDASSGLPASESEDLTDEEDAPPDESANCPAPLRLSLSHLLEAAIASDRDVSENSTTQDVSGRTLLGEATDPESSNHGNEEMERSSDVDHLEDKGESCADVDDTDGNGEKHDREEGEGAELLDENGELDASDDEDGLVSSSSECDESRTDTEEGPVQEDRRPGEEMENCADEKVNEDDCDSEVDDADYFVSAEEPAGEMEDTDGNFIDVVGDENWNCSGNFSDSCLHSEPSDDSSDCNHSDGCSDGHGSEDNDGDSQVRRNDPPPLPSSPLEDDFSAEEVSQSCALVDQPVHSQRAGLTDSSQQDDNDSSQQDDNDSSQQDDNDSSSQFEERFSGGTENFPPSRAKTGDDGDANSDADGVDSADEEAYLDAVSGWESNGYSSEMPSD